LDLVCTGGSDSHGDVPHGCAPGTCLTAEDQFAALLERAG
jgi:hypothetical protein